MQTILGIETAEWGWGKPPEIPVMRYRVRCFQCGTIWETRTTTPMPAVIYRLYQLGWVVEGNTSSMVWCCRPCRPLPLLTMTPELTWLKI